MSKLQKEVLGSLENNKEKVKLWLKNFSKADLSKSVYRCGRCNAVTYIYYRYDNTPVYAICECCGRKTLSDDFTEDDYIYM